MPNVRPNAPYDPKEKSSILEYSAKLEGKTLGEVVDESFFKLKSNNKGSFGSTLESGYFMIDNNNEDVPDFEFLGIELKTTPMKIGKKKKYAPKERMSLCMINYMTILTDGFEGSFMAKNHELLIIFYLDNKEEDIRDKKILRHVLWKFPDEDLRIIENDWNIIANKIKKGLAHEISCGDTFYIEAAPKGAGKGKGMREQPYSKELAKPRAFALKQRYIESIWLRSKDSEPIIKDLTKWGPETTFENMVLDHFKQYEGKNVDELFQIFNLDTNSKSKYAMLANRMMGVKSKKVEELEKAGVLMKTIRLQTNGTPKESMSFPYFKFEDLANGTWEESDFYNDLDQKFLFIVYQIDQYGGTTFKTAKFWNMPYRDLEEARRVWERTADMARKGEISNLPKSVESTVAHVRPHARDKMDTYIGSDGKEYEKKSFWLNSQYLKTVIDNLL